MKETKKLRDEILPRLQELNDNLWKTWSGIRTDSSFDAVGHLEQLETELGKIVKRAKEIETQQKV